MYFPKKTSIEDWRNCWEEKDKGFILNFREATEQSDWEEKDSGFILNFREATEQSDSTELSDSKDVLRNATGARTELMRPNPKP